MSEILNNLKKANKVLRLLEDPVTYVGGAVIPLHIDDPAAPAPRPTQDVDVIVRATNYETYTHIQQHLRELGLRESMEVTDPACRWIYRDLKIDVMPIQEPSFGFTNEWYKEGVQHAVEVEIDDDTTIFIFSAPYLLADKINTFKERGNNDYYASRDFEDIIRLVDGCTNLVKDVKRSDCELYRYVKKWIGKLLDRPETKDFIQAHIRQTGRADIILKRLKDLLR